MFMPGQTQQRIAHEAARIMADDSVTNISTAKQKAMQRLGIQNKRLEPDNIAVESALAEYQQLFKPEHQVSILYKFRKTALRAMSMLKPFSPRLVGAVLRGTATEHDYVSLHVFTDIPEEIHFHLMDHNIPFEIDEYHYQQSKNKIIEIPVCHFMAGKVGISLSIFPYIGLRQAPISSIDEKPMQRVDADTVKTLISG